MTYNEDGEKSIFNAGVAQAERIDSLQRAINASRFNLLAVNPDTMTYNYQVIIDANNSLLDEAWAKLSEKEQQKGRKIRRVIKNLLEFDPPIQKVNVGMSEDIKINSESFTKLTNLIDIYCRTIKVFLNAHDLNSPSRGGDERGFR